MANTTSFGAVGDIKINPGGFFGIEKKRKMGFFCIDSPPGHCFEGRDCLSVFGRQMLFLAPAPPRPLKNTRHRAWLWHTAELQGFGCERMGRTARTRIWALVFRTRASSPGAIGQVLSVIWPSGGGWAVVMVRNMLYI